MFFRKILPLALGILPFLPTNYPAEEATGLILRFGDQDARVSRQVALYVPEGEAVSAFSQPGVVNAVWEGKLNLEARSRLIFTLEGTGKARLLIDGEVLCSEIGTPSERERLSSGAHDIKVEYVGPEEGAAQLRLFWKGLDFENEPVPATAFSHSSEDPALSKFSLLREGHRLMEEHHCANCHGGNRAMAAPSLENLGERLDAAWVARWILDPQAHRPLATMPKVFSGDGAAQKAADIAAFLTSDSKGTGPGGADSESVKTGGHHFYEQGCVGCHTLDAKGDGDRIGLAGVGSKFRPGALAEFLKEPGAHYSATRMPKFGFSDGEASAVAVFLRSLAGAQDKAETADVPKGDPVRGKTLYTSSGCINCHWSGEAESLLPPPAPLSAGNVECKGPMFTLSATEQLAIAAALESKLKPQVVKAEMAQHHFNALRCDACHSRDGEQPLREQYAAEVAALKPPDPPVDEEKPGAHKGEIPNLNHLGMKLQPAWRESLLKGEVGPKLRPWLKARMPAFPARAADLAHGFSHLAGLPSEPGPVPPLDAEKVKAGEQLAGITGFSCGTCHGIGDKPAFAVFEGEGPNFALAGERLRREYMLLWMNDPQRQWPGSIMPKYATEGATPLTQFYDGDAEKQFDAIFEYLRSLPEGEKK